MERRAAVLGSGEVGRSIATGLLTLGWDVTLAGRSAESAGVSEWLSSLHGDHEDSVLARASGGDFVAAVRGASLVVLAVAGTVAVEVVRQAAGALETDAVIIDVTNPLTFPDGRPMELAVANTDSIAEQVQRAVPSHPVVKALNMVNSHLMTHPVEVPGTHVACIAGNDESAKARVREILTAWRWPRVVDLGPIEAARGMESYMHLWLRLWGAIGHTRFNIAIAEGAG